MRCGHIACFLISARLLAGAAVVDRIAVIVGSHAIKTSDVDREVRVTAFLNRQPVDQTPAARKKVAERLIDQELVREELMSGQYAQPTIQDAAAFLQQLKRDRFGGADARFRSEIARYGLTEDQLRRHLLWQLSVLKFIDQRFRANILVTDEEIAKYYDEHRQDLLKAFPRNNSREELTPQIRETLTGERINQGFEEWLAETRKRTRIDYRPQAFDGGGTQ
jgi:hypothetical protein